MYCFSIAYDHHHHQHSRPILFFIVLLRKKKYIPIPFHPPIHSLCFYLVTRDHQTREVVEEWSKCPPHHNEGVLVEQQVREA